jgi:uncharacterized protein (DUF1697 family)
MPNDRTAEGSRPGRGCQTGRVPTFVVFLRAINLGKRRRVPMAELVDCLEQSGCHELATHLATGNVRLSTPAESHAAVEGSVERACAARFGFEVPALAYTPDEVRALVTEGDQLDVGAARQYVTLLKQPAPPDVAVELDAWSAPGEGARVGTRAVHWWSVHGTQGSRLGNEAIERRLGVATTRTLGVVRTVADKWCR